MIDCTNMRVPVTLDLLKYLNQIYRYDIAHLNVLAKRLFDSRWIKFIA